MGISCRVMLPYIIPYIPLMKVIIVLAGKNVENALRSYCKLVSDQIFDFSH